MPKILDHQLGHVFILYKGTSLEQLPLRAQLVLKEEGWTEQNILSTWPNGATNKLIGILVYRCVPGKFPKNFCFAHVLLIWNLENRKLSTLIGAQKFGGI